MIRAVEDAVHHSSLTMVRTLGVDRDAVHIEIKFGVQKPGQMDTAAVKKALTFGQITENVVTGGLDVVDEDAADIVIRMDLP